jgi:hypothetical protein
MGQLPRINANNSLRRVVVFFLLLTGISGALSALDLRIAGGVGNILFDPDQTSSLGLEESQFEPFIYPFGLVSLEGEYSNRVNYRVAFDRDPVLQNRLLATVGFDFNFIRIEAGPFAGLFDAGGRIINPGIAAVLELAFPGIIFGSVKGSSTIGAPVLLPGDFFQGTGEIALGFWVPHVICTLAINNKSFTSRKSEELLIKDELTRYLFRADVFTKNIPYTLRIDMGYQSLKRSYSPVDETIETDEFKSIFIGCEGTWQINSSFQLILGAEMPVYSWGEKPLKGPERKTFMYQFQAGLVWTFPAAQ